MNPFTQPDLNGISPEGLQNRLQACEGAIKYWQSRKEGNVPWWDSKKKLEPLEFIDKNIQFFSVQKQAIEIKIKRKRE
jgi:hypothetical protein